MYNMSPVTTTTTREIDIETENRRIIKRHQEMEFKDFFLHSQNLLLLRPLDIMNILAYFPTATPLSFVR